jgi:hypothetical protein
MSSIWFWRQAAIVSLYSVNWLDLLVDTDCVYCAVRSESL